MHFKHFVVKNSDQNGVLKLIDVYVEYPLHQISLYYCPPFLEIIHFKITTIFSSNSYSIDNWD